MQETGFRKHCPATPSTHCRAEADRSAVQVVLQLTSGALLLDSNTPIQLPACRDRHAQSVLTVRSSG